MPKWSKLQIADIRRADVRALMDSIAAPVVANQTLAAASAVFAWAIREDIITANPCTGIDRNETKSRDRFLNDAELPLFWRALDDVEAISAAALRTILLTGQRPGEIVHMRREHLGVGADAGWWNMPGKPATAWPGTKNGKDHKVWLPQRAREIVAWLSDENETTDFVFGGARGRPNSDLDGMRSICAKIGIERCTPHDLRRTFATWMEEQGFGDDYIDRVLNHAVLKRRTKVQETYNRHKYEKENQQAMNIKALAKYLTTAYMQPCTPALQANGRSSIWASRN